MKRLDRGDAEEEGSGSSGLRAINLAEKIAAMKGKRDRHKALLDELDRKGDDQISLTDPDARAMARMTKVAVGYNIQLAVDVKHKLIAEQEVSNQVVDMGLLTQTTQTAMDNFGVEEILAARYFCCSRASHGPERAVSIHHGYDRSPIPLRFATFVRCEKPIASDTLSNAVRVLIPTGSQLKQPMPNAAS